MNKAKVAKNPAKETKIVLASKAKNSKQNKISSITLSKEGAACLYLAGVSPSIDPLGTFKNISQLIKSKNVLEILGLSCQRLSSEKELVHELENFKGKKLIIYLAGHGNLSQKEASTLVTPKITLDISEVSQIDQSKKNEETSADYILEVDSINVLSSAIKNALNKVNVLFIADATMQGSLQFYLADAKMSFRESNPSALDLIEKKSVFSN